jgi:hypothetical protein
MILSAASTVNRVATCIRSPFPRAHLSLRQTQSRYRQPPAQIAFVRAKFPAVGTRFENAVHRGRGAGQAGNSGRSPIIAGWSSRGTGGPPLHRYSWAVNVAPAR